MIHVPGGSDKKVLQREIVNILSKEALTHTEFKKRIPYRFLLILLHDVDCRLYSDRRLRSKRASSALTLSYKSQFHYAS